MAKKIDNSKKWELTTREMKQLSKIRGWTAKDDKNERFDAWKRRNRKMP